MSVRLSAFLRYLALSRKPIILGPWRSELGFEVLYWLPFLAWAQATYGIPIDRCIALSRGGMGMLYPATRQVDLYTLRGYADCRLENNIDYERQKLQKQFTVTQWDRDVAQEAARRLGVRSYHVLHPSWMYGLFNPAWEEQDGLNLVQRHARFEPIPVPDVPNGVTLPKAFTAVKFYDRATFPASGPVKQFCEQVVARLAARGPVVLLNQPYCLDDHIDMTFAGQNIFTLPEVKPEQNFLMQASVLAKAEAFVGTYGGVAQWALRYKKPSLSFYEHFKGTAHAHLHLSRALSSHFNVPFEVVQLGAKNLWTKALTMPAPKKGLVHATQDGTQQAGYPREHPQGSPRGQAPEAGGRHRLPEGGQGAEAVV